MESNDDQESLRRFASSLNTHKFPILDVGSVEISEAEEVAQTMHLFGRNRNDILDGQAEHYRRQLPKGIEINYLKQQHADDEGVTMMRADILDPIATSATTGQALHQGTDDTDDGTPLNYRLPVLSREKFGMVNLEDGQEATSYRSHSRRHTSSPSNHHRHHRRHRHSQFSNRQVILTAKELQELVQTVNLEATTADHTRDIVRKIRERMASAEPKSNN